MEEIRGMDAVRYAGREGIQFNVDEAYLLRAEGELGGKPATPQDIQDVFYEKLGRDYDRTDLLPGEESFNLLVRRYGDGWIYVPLTGNHPEREEREALRLFRRPLKRREPYCGGDLLDLASRYAPRLRGTGYAPDADLNLLYHAALRLVGRGELEAVDDESPLPPGECTSYGRKRFLVTIDVEVPLGRALCDMCREEYDTHHLPLHYECAGRLNKALTKVLSRRKAG